MGRRRSSNFDDPPRFHRKGNVWYHVSGSAPRVWTKLSNDRAEALRLWAMRESIKEDESSRLLSTVAQRYMREVFPQKSIQTQKDNAKELANLLKVFGHMPIDQIQPMHIREYLDIRGQTAKVRANREKALFSHIFNKAREWGYTNAQNPCQGVKGFKEAGRDRYVTDEEFERVKLHAHSTVVNAMELALLIGQRPADVLKIRKADLRDGALWIVQNKTNARLGIEVTGALADLVERLLAASDTAHSSFLISDTNGQPLTYAMLRGRFKKACELAEVSFQFRDIRAKAATDTNDLAHSQKLLGHKNRDMTEHYVRTRKGDLVKPLR